jgi:cellulase/cellobiase CelA1
MMRFVTRRWLIPVLSVLCAATAFGVATVAHAATACRVAYSVTGQWQNGFQAALTVTNLGDAWTGWTLTFPFTAGQKVTQLWGAQWSQPAATVTATGESWNATVPTNGSASIGFLASWSGTNPAPTSFAVNGVTCTGSAPATTAPTTARTTTTPTTRGTTPTTRAATTPTTRPTPTTASCAGRITYTLNRAGNPTADQLSAYNQITTAMNQALSVYNCQTTITKALTVSYDPGVPTADATYSGHIRFGARSSMQQITAMHEISHTLGVGTAPGWSSRLSNGVWTGAAATAELRRQTGDNSAVLRGDSIHFWPYGLNYTSEVTSPNDLVIHCRIVVALRQDLGI